MINRPEENGKLEMANDQFCIGPQASSLPLAEI
jgi:hypothetical protein